MTVVMLLVCQTRRGDFGYIGGHMQWSYVYVQLSDCSESDVIKWAGTGFFMQAIFHHIPDPFLRRNYMFRPSSL